MDIHMWLLNIASESINPRKPVKVSGGFVLLNVDYLTGIVVPSLYHSESASSFATLACMISI
jgi:hypothetical protein